MAEQPLLELENLERIYPGIVPVRALGPVSLRINAGEHVAIVGPSGSGKSTLLNVLGLLDRPTAGFYRFEGQDVATASERIKLSLRARHFGFVFQAFHLLGHKTVLENVEMGGLYAGIPRRNRRANALELLHRVGLDHRVHADPRQLSGGEKQRVAIARALTNHPQILFCDEPTGSLDIDNSNNVSQLIRELNNEGITIVMVTHDEALAALAARVIRVADGVISEESYDPAE